MSERVSERVMLINASQIEETRIAIIEKNQLIDLDLEVTSHAQKKANIYKAVISRVEPSLNAVFVDYGAEKHGFLPIKEISAEYFTDPAANPYGDDAHRYLKPGNPLLVQIEKEERGNKGAALTTYISLAGCYMVLMPNNPKAGGISRRIEGDERQELKDIAQKLSFPEKMGTILRTACIGRSIEELQWDLDTLLKFWNAIQEAYDSKPGPFLIYQESDIILRAVRDHLKDDIREIIVDNKEAYNRVLEHVKRLRPDFTNRVKLEEHMMSLFARYRIEGQIESAYARDIQLPSGGSIVIDHTEALTSIDINSAKATKGGDIEETALQTNIEAAHEIAKQLKIRDLGGLIVIDFIDMYAQKNQREVENQLAQAIKSDRARIQLGKISQFGLLELSRQRLQPSLSEATTLTCPRCLGHGTIRSTQSMVLSLIRRIREMAHQKPGMELVIQAPIDVATYLLNEKRREIDQIEYHSKCLITLIPNRHMETPQFTIAARKPAKTHTLTASYDQVDIPENDDVIARAETAVFEKPAVSGIMIEDAPPSSLRKPKGGLLSSLWKAIFSGHSAANQAQPPQKAAANKPHRNEGRNKRPSNSQANQQGQNTQGSQQTHAQGHTQGQNTQKPARGTSKNAQSSQNTRNSSGRRTPNASNVQQQNTPTQAVSSEGPTVINDAMLTQNHPPVMDRTERVARPERSDKPEREKSEGSSQNTRKRPAKSSQNAPVEASTSKATGPSLSVAEPVQAPKPAPKPRPKKPAVKLPEGALLNQEVVLEAFQGNPEALLNTPAMVSDHAVRVESAQPSTLPKQSLNGTVDVVSI